MLRRGIRFRLRGSSAADAADRLFVSFGIPYPTLVWVFRVAFFVLPVAAFLVTRRLCREIAAERGAAAAAAAETAA